MSDGFLNLISILLTTYIFFRGIYIKKKIIKKDSGGIFISLLK